MTENSKIEWTTHSFNPWTGCEKVSPGCLNCYAEGWAKRSGIVKWGPGQERRRTSESYWRDPIKWHNNSTMEIDEALHDMASETYEAPPRPRVFCASLADWLDPAVPIEWLSDLLYLIAKTPALDWLLLTKRPQLWKQRMQDCAAGDEPGAQVAKAWLGGFPLPHVWVGTTVEDQTRADQRIPILIDIPARVRFLSCEPMLEFVDLNIRGHRSADENPIHWVICGGESGPGCRPFHPAWARSLRDQCAADGIGFFMKQMGGARKPFLPIPHDLRIQELPTIKAR